MSIKKNKILFILFIVVFIDYTSGVFIFPFLPSLLQELTHETIANSSIWAGVMMTGYFAMQFIFAPIIGSLSDKHGRKPIIIISLLAFGVNYIGMAIANNIYILILLRLILGICGACVTAVLAAITDFSNGLQRLKNISIIYSALGSALVFGPLLGSILSLYNNRFPFLCAGVWSVITSIICYAFLPETLTTDKRKNFNFISILKSILNISQYSSLKGLFIMQLLFTIAFETMFTLLAFYTTHKLSWKEYQIGLSLAYSGILICLVQIFITKYFYIKLGQVRCTIYGLFFFAIGALIMGLAINSFYVYMSLLFYSLGSIYNSSIMSFFTSKVSENEQGKLQGVLSSINGLGFTISPIMMTWIFHYSIKHKVLFEDSNPFFLSAILFVISILIACIAFRRS